MNIKNPLVSIIIPIYNGERHLGECLDSVCMQSYTNIEIVTVNDGSTDNSLSILNQYAKNDHRIVIINKSNEGVSSSRNAALDLLHGTYLFFLDADDRISNNCIEVLVNALFIDMHTIPMAHIYRFDKNSRTLYDFGYTKDQSYMSYDEYFSKLLTGNISAVIWGKLFPTYLFKGLRFSTSLSHGEDLVLLISLFKTNKGNISIWNNAFYEYRYNESSVTAALSEKGILSNINKFIEILSLNLSKYEMENLTKRVYLEYWLLCKDISLSSSFILLDKIRYINKVNYLLRVNKICHFWSMKEYHISLKYRLFAMLFSFLRMPFFGIVGCHLLKMLHVI